jgi:hypothetical protein
MTFSTLINVYTVGSGGTITTIWREADSGPTFTEGQNQFTISTPATADGLTPIYTANDSLFGSSFPNGKTWNVYIQSGNPIAGNVILLDINSAYAAGHALHPY